MGKYLLRGVDRSSGKDVEFVVEADTSANARAKGDLKGTIVTEVIDLMRGEFGSTPSIAPVSKKPWKVTAIGGMRLGSGICNIIAGLLLGFVFFLPLLLIPLGIIEILSATGIMKTPPKRSDNLLVIPILEIVAIVTLSGWIPLVVGILSIVWLGDNTVKECLASVATKTQKHSPPPLPGASQTPPSGQ